MKQINELYNYFEKVLDKFLTENKMRNSESRKELLRFLCDEKNGLQSHFEAEEVYRSLSLKSYNVSRASVFRNLALFSESKILRKSKFGENHFHYELCDKLSFFHHHLICKYCGKVIEFKSPKIKEYAAYAAKKYKFSEIEYRFEIYGICNKCKKEK